MITMMNKAMFNNNPRIYLIIMEGIKKVVTLLLMLGAHSKPKEEIQAYSEYSIENKRKIIIESNFAHFKTILKYISKSFWKTHLPSNNG